LTNHTTVAYTKKNVAKSQDSRDLILDSIQNNILFRTCTKDEFTDIVDAFEPVWFPPKTVVIQQGDEDGEQFYVVQSGSLDISVKGSQFLQKAPCKQGDSFGEQALVYDIPRGATITTREDCKLWTIDRTHFRSIQQHHKLSTTNMHTDLLRNVSIGDKNLKNHLTSGQFTDMLSVLDTDTFPKDEVIIREGMGGDIFYIIVSGTVDVFTKATGKNPVRTLHRKEYFGELALLSEDVRSATCVASSDVECLFLVRSDFVRLIGPLANVLDSKEIYRRDSLNCKISDSMKKATKTLGNTSLFSWTLSDLKMNRTIGAGAFGRVKLVELNSKYYALKCIAKSVVVKKKLQSHILNEKTIMATLNHPFITKFHGATQDEKYLYFLTEFLVGGEVYSLLKKKKRFEEKQVQFYSACVVSAFSDMHDQKIAYRDLKPENLVLDASGYVKVIDFGFTTKVEGKTWTFCGTPDYLAPEIIVGDGHDWGVDCWALGILLFEMTTGKAPFRGRSPMELFEAIMAGRFIMPKSIDKHLSDLIVKLVKNPVNKRLGKTKGGTRVIMKHKYYRKLDWKALEKCELKAPYQPPIQNPGDTQNFRQMSEVEMNVENCPEWNPVL